MIKLNSSIKLKLLELYLSSLIYFYSKKKIIIKLHLLTEKIQEVKLPFLFNILKDTEKKQRFIIIILSFMFFNAGILTTYLNNIITNLKNKKHIHTITFFFEKLRLTFLQQIVPLSGIKFKLAGRLNGKLRKSKYGYTIGSVKLMTLNLNFSYSYDCVYTQYGVFSLKLWLAEWNNINDQKKTI